MLHTLLTVKTTEFYETFHAVGGVVVYILMGLFALMLLYATIKYVKP